MDAMGSSEGSYSPLKSSCNPASYLHPNKTTPTTANGTKQPIQNPNILVTFVQSSTNGNIKQSIHNYNPTKIMSEENNIAEVVEETKTEEVVEAKTGPGPEPEAAVVAETTEAASKDDKVEDAAADAAADAVDDAKKKEASEELTTRLQNLALDRQKVSQ